MGFPDSSVGKTCNEEDSGFWAVKICWRRDRLPTPVFLGFPSDSASKESTCNAGDLGLIPGLGRSPGEGKGYPLWYSALENSMDCIVQGVTKSQIWLRNFHFSRLMNQTLMIETPEIPLIPILFTRLQVPTIGSHQSAISKQCLTSTSSTFCPSYNILSLSKSHNCIHLSIGL